MLLEFDAQLRPQGHAGRGCVGRQIDRIRLPLIITLVGREKDRAPADAVVADRHTVAVVAALEFGR